MATRKFRVKHGFHVDGHYVDGNVSSREYIFTGAIITQEEDGSLTCQITPRAQFTRKLFRFNLTKGQMDVNLVLSS
jgi:hypothetical protein